MLNKIEESFDSESPVLFISHLLISFHTPNYYNYYNESDYNNFLQSYKLSVPKTSEIINLIVSKIIEEDPNCLIYIFGDHGLHASRGIEYKTPNFDLLKFSVLDRFGAFGALYTNDYLYKQVINKYINESKSTNHIDNISQILKYLTGHNPVLGKTNNSLESDMYPDGSLMVINSIKFVLFLMKKST